MKHLDLGLGLLLGLVLAPAPAPAMVFTPSPDTAGHMRSNWDNWGQINNGTWYLYYIVGGECPGRWVAYGVATSRDGVRWSDKGDMLYASLGGEQQSCSNGGYALGSGWVWQDPATEKWLLDFSESTTDRGEPGQSIFFGQSDTPMGPWENVTIGPAPKPFREDPRYYREGGRWDTIRVVPKDPPAKGWFGFVTANPLVDPLPPLPPGPPGPPPPRPGPGPEPAPQLPAPSACTVTKDFGCHTELDCGANVSRRCLGNIVGKAASRSQCACACHRAGYTLAGLEKGDCFCGHGESLDPTKCGDVPASNASKVCTAGDGGGNCAVSAFAFSCSGCAPTPPPPPQPPIRPGFALVESTNGYDWTCLPAPLINFKTFPANPAIEASGVQPMLGPDGKTRWYALVGAVAETSIGARMGMFAYVADNITGPYEELANHNIMAYQQGWTRESPTPAYFLSFFPTEEHGMLLNHQVVAPGGSLKGGDFVAPLKATHIATDGSLRLVYWKGNDVLKGPKLPLSSPPSGGGGGGRGEREKQVIGNLTQLPGFVASGTIATEAGGALALCECSGTTSNSTIKISPALVAEIWKSGHLVETVDRTLTPALLRSWRRSAPSQPSPAAAAAASPAAANSDSVDWVLLQRHSMWEFYLGGFLILPERLASAYSCVELVASGGLAVADVWEMVSMPASTPVPVAPTYPHR